MDNDHKRFDQVRRAREITRWTCTSHRQMVMCIVRINSYRDGGGGLGFGAAGTRREQKKT